MIACEGIFRSIGDYKVGYKLDEDWTNVLFVNAIRWLVQSELAGLRLMTLD